MRSMLFRAAIVYGVLLLSGAAQSANFRVIHTFCAETNCTDGQNPLGSLTVDAQGNIYGVTVYGGAASLGTVYVLKPGHGRKFSLETLYSFCTEDGCPVGQMPTAGVIRDISGNLYGMTSAGGTGDKGVAYKLALQSDGTWTQTVLQTFTGPNGASPLGAFAYAGEASGAPYDGTSPLYGTTISGGTDPNGGTVFALTPDGSNWSFETILNFSAATNSQTGFQPLAAPVVDASGNLFGTTNGGPAHNGGVVFKLVHGHSGWTEHLPHIFCTGCNDNTSSPAGLAMDATGNLVGTTGFGGPSCVFTHHGPKRCGGGIFRLTPNGKKWDYAALYDFCAVNKACRDGNIETISPAPVIDASGNIYGTTSDGGRYGYGVLFRIRTDGTYEILHSFCKPGNCGDGGTPDGLGIDAEGHIYGIAVQGNANNAGTVFEYTP